MLVEQWPIERVKPYEKNPRRNDAAVDAVATAIKQFGFRQPIVVDKHNVIVVGHTRWKAALKLGMKLVPVHVAKDLTQTQINAYRLADNKTNELAEWDSALLTEELKALQAAAFDIGNLAFDMEELEKYLGAGFNGAAGLGNPDDVPAPPLKATTKRGDLWILGEHRLKCGDSSIAEDVASLMAGATAQCVNTDPPYNVAVIPRSNTASKAGHNVWPLYEKKNQTVRKTLIAKDRVLDNDEMTPAAFREQLTKWLSMAAAHLDVGRACYFWLGYSNIGVVPPVMAECGLKFSQPIVWVKNSPVLSRKDFNGNMELCFYGWKEGGPHYFNSKINNVTDTWVVKADGHTVMKHVTQKPVELAVRALTYSTRPRENVLDLFGGSGSTLIAAEQTGRRAFLMEIDQLYCDVIKNRFETFTSKKAFLQRGKK